MKKYLVICAAIAVVSCSKKETNPDMDTNVMLEEPVVKTVDSAAAGKHEGLALIEGADCLTCHKVDARVVGPSYQEVADKYTEADVEMLANKIIEGGKGAWGEIPMTPHAGMSKENAKKMVEYILTLKK
ncbi:MULTISPECIES: c-type cytochrome [unclassified Kaistella]|uniref:c-type cytochrome n=1 Tax=unclassified Kaistella TaxID=2762626 RepID=UPI00273567A7|nr:MULTISPECIES: c-type cytochrome [unclassified Kaistella]MCZ2083544.1 c-type cytochrome [Flavobacteriales bacterium]MDP2454168.1 c-type cytochrome [Kaistella sp. SH11-4b]MDP2457761.1 c-type cytochrome [Kaistella sp. SH40-3]MDP2460519.1 c-type cytochrome [Kaistella sp. SH19-2b]